MWIQHLSISLLLHFHFFAYLNGNTPWFSALNSSSSIGTQKWEHSTQTSSSPNLLLSEIVSTDDLQHVTELFQFFFFWNVICTGYANHTNFLISLHYRSYSVRMGLFGKSPLSLGLFVLVCSRAQSLNWFFLYTHMLLDVTDPTALNFNYILKIFFSLSHLTIF
jgi:hypothetical protein